MSFVSGTRVSFREDTFNFHHSTQLLSIFVTDISCNFMLGNCGSREVTLLSTGLVKPVVTSVTMHRANRVHLYRSSLAFPKEHT